MDIWSVGCVMIEMVTGKPPWSDLDPPGVLAQLQKYSIPGLPPTLLSDLGMDFLCYCLDPNYQTRPNTSKLLTHAWLQPQPDPLHARSFSYDQTAQQRRQSYNRHSSFSSSESHYTYPSPTDVGIPPRAQYPYQMQGANGIPMNLSVPSSPSYITQPLPTAVVPVTQPSTTGQRIKYMPLSQERLLGTEYFAAVPQPMQQSVMPPEIRNYYQEVHLHQLEAVCQQPSPVAVVPAQGDVPAPPRASTETMPQPKHTHSKQKSRRRTEESGHDMKSSSSSRQAGYRVPPAPKFTSVSDAVFFEDAVRQRQRAKSSDRGDRFKTSVADAVLRDEKIRRNVRSPSMDVNDLQGNPYSFEDGIDITVATAAVQQHMEERSRRAAAARYPGFVYGSKK